MSTERRLDMDEKPEGDLIDQITPVDPDHEEESFEDRPRVPFSADEADWIDQQIPAPLDEEEQEQP